jgi:hypothetical protein
LHQSRSGPREGPLVQALLLGGGATNLKNNYATHYFDS